MPQRRDAARQSPDQMATTDELVRSWKLALRAKNLARSTLTSYCGILGRFDRFCAAHDLPQQTARIEQKHVQAWIQDTLERGAASTAATYYICLHVFFSWCVDEGEISRSPMERMHPPQVPDKLTPVLSRDQIGKLLKACDGKSFLDKRDTAIILLFLATGMRRAELVNLRVEDLDFEEMTVQATLKGGRAHVFPIDRRASAALDRYLRARRDHRDAAIDWLWLGQKGRLHYHGIEDMLKSREERADIGHIHAHLFRHTFSHLWLDAGKSEGGLMHTIGWRTRKMIDRYGRSVAEKRARDEYHKIEPGDQF